MFRCAVGLAMVCLWCVAAAQAETPPVIYSAQSGAWSDAATWQGGKVPGHHACVLVQPDHRVTYDVASDVVIRTINVAGTLAFANDRDTLLNVGLIKIERTRDFSESGFDCETSHEDHGHHASRAALEVGTAKQPIPAKFTAKIRLHYIDGHDRESCPAINCCGGKMDFHGAPLSRTWLKLGATADKGASSVMLSEAVTGWRVGDRILITATESYRGTDGTRRPSKQTEDVFTEERTITALDGVKLSLDRPLDHAHLGAGELRGEVANLSRNVIVESAAPDGERGHTMYHRGSQGSIHYAEFRHLGKENVLGRYSLHFHLCGNSMRGSSVIGASIWDSHNRWLTIHGTNYLLVRDNVGYRSVGHGYYLEDGTEVYNVLDRNLAVQAFVAKKLPKQVLPFDANDGAGFWWSNSLNTFTRNVSCENDRYGFRFEATPSSQFDITALDVMQADGRLAKTDVRTLPFVRFADNEAHCDGKYGVNLGEGVRQVGPDAQHPFVMHNTKIWETHYAFRPQSPSLLCTGLHIENCDYGVYHPHYDRYVFKDVKILNVDAEPFNRGHDDDSVQYGSLTVDGLEFGAKYFGGGMPFIQITDHNPTGSAAAHFRQVSVRNRPANGKKALVNLGGGPRPTPKSEESVPVFMHDYFGPGRHAKVVSVKTGEYVKQPSRFREEAPLTGDQSRVAEVTNVEFPTLLTPVDDLPPQTVITSIEPRGDQLLVRGVVSDNGEVRRVSVNGIAAQHTPGELDWQVTLPATGKLIAFSEDAAGNVEKLPHEIK